jgi:hypothetical protein
MAILEQIGMVRIRKAGGCQPSECSLVDLKKLAAHLGASKSKKLASYVLAPGRAKELKSQIAALRTSMEVKHRTANEPRSASGGKLAHPGATDLFLLDSKRDAIGSQKRRQHSTRETQMGTHLIREERRIENAPSPTPSLEREPSTPKSLSSEDEKQEPPKWACDSFNGAVDEIRDHLLDTNRPSKPHLANGYADWEKFGFNNLAVEAAERRGEVLVLTLSASDPAAARLGLAKYHRKWDECLRTWFGCEVRVELQSNRAKN